MLSETEEWDEALCLVPQRDSGHLESQVDPAADAVVQIDAWDFEPPLAVGFSIRAATLISQWPGPGVSGSSVIRGAQACIVMSSPGQPRYVSCSDTSNDEVPASAVSTASAA